MLICMSGLLCYTLPMPELPDLEVIKDMYCSESDIDATHLQKVGSAFQVPSVDEVTRPERC